MTKVLPLGLGNSSLSEEDALATIRTIRTTIAIFIFNGGISKVTVANSDQSVEMAPGSDLIAHQSIYLLSAGGTKG